jgi:hypothetical protein
MKRYITAAIIASIFAEMLVIAFAYEDLTKQTVLACGKCKKHRKKR